MTEQPVAEETTVLGRDPSYDEAARPRRAVKVAHLVVGLVFLGIAALWALDAAGVADSSTARYLAPAVLVGAGVIGLAALLVSSRRRGVDQ